jgi:opine dehydrogenase
MKIAILGAGNVALANACYLAHAGHDVFVWSSLSEERAELAAAGAITYEGFMAGRAKFTASPDAGSCIARAEVVMIAAPAFAHQTLMSAACPYLTEKQHIVVHPVTGLSSLLLSRMLKDRGIKPVIVDLSTSLFATRKTSATSVRLFSIKNLIEMAAIPADRSNEAMARLEALFGNRFMLEPNALAISLNNHNPVYHIPPMLCNLSRAEKKEDWIIWENITPGVARFVRLVDDERLSVVRYYGTTEVPVDQYFRQSYGIDGKNLDEIFSALTDKLRGPVGPQDFNHRFILEDVPYALVFFSSLGHAAGIEMPITDSLIQITSALYRRDFIKEGHTLEALGLAGLGSRQIVEMTRTGF